MEGMKKNVDYAYTREKTHEEKIHGEMSFERDVISTKIKEKKKIKTKMNLSSFNDKNLQDGLQDENGLHAC